LKEFQVRPPQRIFFGFSVLAIISLFASGCASFGKCKAAEYLDASQGQLLTARTLNPQDPAALEKWSGPVFENDKIRFLLDRIAGSEYRFIRNGEVHDGKVARRWLLYKMTHWVSNVNSAADFVTHVAGYSQRTGDPYLVEFPDGQVYSLKSILSNELSSFEADLKKIKKIRETTSLNQPNHPNPISFSPTAVATTAVASAST
jgi:hypothetical protein